MCGCTSLTCVGGCPCGCRHTLKEHDIALRDDIAKSIETLAASIQDGITGFSPIVTLNQAAELFAANARGHE